MNKYLLDSFSEDEQNDIAEMDEEFELAEEMRLSLMEKSVGISPEKEEQDEPKSQE